MEDYGIFSDTKIKKERKKKNIYIYIYIYTHTSNLLNLIWSKTYRRLHQSRPRNSHGLDGLKHINDLFNLQTFQY